MNQRRQNQRPPARLTHFCPRHPGYLASLGSLLTSFVRLPVPHLYVHVPFCPKVCPYCSFYKEASDRNKTRPFLDAVLAELDQRQATGPALRPETIFFGGGTPSALSPSQLEYLLGGLRARLDLSALAEWTFEMNPATVSLEKARLLRDLGVNRISMGVQSWDPAILRTLGRVHSADQARRSYAILRGAGFDNVNLDLIFAVPGQTREIWRDSLRETIALAPDHISAYNLTYEEDTEFFRRFSTGEYTQDADDDAGFFEETADLLAAAGYEPYEISNFARPGRRCAHNGAYWRGADYLGLGPSAFSTVGGRRWSSVRDTAAYTARILAGQSAEDFSEPTPPEVRHREAVVFGLRTSDGVALADLAPWSGRVASLLAEGLLAPLPAGRVALTRRGRLVADAVGAEFI